VKYKDQQCADEQETYFLKCFSLNKYLKSVSTSTARKLTRKENFTHKILFSWSFRKTGALENEQNHLKQTGYSFERIPKVFCNGKKTI